MISCAFGMFCCMMKEFDRGHDHVVTAVHDECWLLDRLQIVVGPLLLDAPLVHRFDLGGRHLVVHFGIAALLPKMRALQELPSRRLARRGRTEFDREPDMLGRIVGWHRRAALLAWVSNSIP